MRDKGTVSKTAIWCGMAGIYIGWGTTYIATHYALEAFPSFLMTGARNILAGVILYVFQRLRGARQPDGRMWKSAFGVGLLVICAGSGINVWAQQIVPTGVASLLIGSIPLWMALLDIIGSKRAKTPGPGGVALTGIFFGFAGILLLIGPVNILGSGVMVNPKGAAALLIGSLFWSAGSLKSRTAVFPSSRVLGSGMQMIAGGIGLIAVGFLLGEHRLFSPEQVSARGILGLVYLTVVGSIFSFAIYTWLLWSAPTTLVSTYAYVNPIVAVILGALILKEVVSLRLIIASAMILAAVAIVSVSSGAKPRSSAQSPPDSK
jgi:drug/metabolite transporter (DMT)-like permease